MRKKEDDEKKELFIFYLHKNDFFPIDVLEIFVWYLHKSDRAIWAYLRATKILFFFFSKRQRYAKKYIYSE